MTVGKVASSLLFMLLIASWSALPALADQPLEIHSVEIHAVTIATLKAKSTELDKLLIETSGYYKGGKKNDWLYPSWWSCFWGNKHNALAMSHLPREIKHEYVHNNDFVKATGTYSHDDGVLHVQNLQKDQTPTTELTITAPEEGGELPVQKESTQD